MSRACRPWMGGAMGTNMNGSWKRGTRAAWLLAGLMGCGLPDAQAPEESGQRSVALVQGFGPAELVRDINAVPGVGASNPANLVLMDGVLYFSAETEWQGRELWRSDGTPE